MFGAGNNNPNWGSGSSTFGGTTTTPSVFGAVVTSAPSVFGASSTSTPSIFGAGSMTTPSVFGAGTTATPGVFGAGTATSQNVFGASTAVTPNVFGAGTTTTPNVFGASTATAPNVFGAGTTSTSNIFGASTTNTTNVFGASTATTPSVFRASTATAPTVFGASTTTGPGVFGASTTTAPGVFGASATTTPNIFGASTTTAAGVFGAGTTTAPNVFGASTPTAPGVFGASTTATPNVFGASTTTAPSVFGAGTTTTAPGVFGANTATTPNVFGASTTTVPSVFGASTTTAPGVFGANTATTPNVFGASTTTVPGVFGASTTTTPGVFGASTTTASGAFGASTTTASGVFGAVTTTAFGKGGGSSTTAASTNPFPIPAITSSQQTTNVFGNVSKPFATAPPSNVFGQTNPAVSTAGFGAPAATATPFGNPAVTKPSVFGAKIPPTTDGSSSVPSSTGFGQTSVSSSTTSKGLFGKTATADTSAPKSLLGKEPTSSTAAANLFGKPTTDSTAKNLFGTKPSSTNETTTTLFGKTSATASSAESSSAAPVPSLFGKPAEKQESSTGLFGKGGSTTEPARPGSRSIIQRPSTSKDQDVKTKPAGLFGRAIANVTEEKDKPRGIHRLVTAERPKGPSERPKRSPPTETRPIRRRSTMDDLSQFTVLIAKNVPPSVNNKVAIRKHFSRFGKVSKVYPTPAKNMVTVHFEDHESALNAKKNGGIVRQGLPKLSLFWKALAPKAGTSPSTETSPTLQTSPEAGPSRASRVPKSLFSGPPKEVNAELASMGGADDDTFGTGMKVLQRPTDLQSDPLAGSLAQPLPRLSRSPDHKRDRPSSSERPSRGSRREKARSVSPVDRKGRAPREPVEMPKAKVVPREDSASPVPMTAPIVSVKSLIGKRCVTDQERLDVLEARDKLLREARGVLNKGKDLATASAIKGTCLDMCPEKERYLRQERRRLTMYEIHPQSDGRGLVDHARAVKEYSRSSADQDMPLANELRPSHVLERTLSYILNNIIGLGDDGKWSDWYEYIWSRTRGIRKDITQQQLCDQTAVALVERCARFHIYCAERLCMEDAAVFDMKINDENLTKCLQTLKELYHDLAVKHGQHCEHEAEFRAYVVLMNLNEGDTLRETQQLRSEIREAPPVKFALSVYSALNSNNYIRFFKLVRQSSFLNACILHRYFNQVRSAALLTMCMAYSVPGKNALVPISEMVRLLGFEDDEGVISFCEHHGLPTEGDSISMMRNNYMEPETAMAKRRAMKLIEAKLTTSAGDAIHGSPLPPNEILTPTSSFDSEGRFCPDAATLQVVQEQEGEDDVPPPQPTVRSASPAPQAPAALEAEAAPAPSRHPYSNDAVKAVAKEIFLEVIEEICKEMSHNLVQTCHIFLNKAGPLTEQFIDEQIPQLTRQISEEVVQEERTRVEKEARARAEKSIRREQIAEQLRSDMTEETLQQIIFELAQEETQEVDHQLRQESQQRCSLTYVENLLLEVLNAETEQLTADFYEQEVEQKRQALAQAEKATHILRQRRHFQRWKNKLAGRQRLKRSMLDFPAAPSMYSPSERLQRILPESTGLSESRNAVHLGNNAWLTLTPPNVVVEKENELIQEILRQNEEARQKLVLCRSSIDVCRVVGPLLVRKLSHSNRGKTVKGNIERVYWKLLLSLPQAETLDEEDYNDWVINKLSTCDDNFPPEIYNRLAEVIGQSVHTEKGVDGQPVNIHAAVRYMTGLRGDTEISQLQKGIHLQATNAVLFLVGRRTVSNAQTWQMERRRLHQVLSLFNTSKLALIIAAPPGMVGESRLKLADLCKHVLFSHVVPLADDVINPATTLQVQTALEDLARHCPPHDPLRAEWITDYLEHGLQRFFYSKLQNSVFSNNPEHHLNQVAAEMVELYNAAVEHLANVAGDPGLQDVSWPPIEFCHTNNDLPMPDWNSEKSLHYLSELINTLTLPPYEDDVRGDDCWADACAAVWQYVRLVAADTEGTDVFLVSRIRNLLQQARELFEDQCLWTTGVADAEPSGSNIPWSRIIRLCIDHKMACLNTLVPDANQNPLDYDEIQVFYETVQMDSFKVPNEWLSVCRQSPDRSVLETSIRRAVKRKQDKVTSMTPEVSSKKKSTRYSLTELNYTKLDLDPTDPELLEAQTQAGELLGELAAEKRAVCDYEKYLEDLLKEGELPLPPVPNIHHTLSSSLL